MTRRLAMAAVVLTVLAVFGVVFTPGAKADGIEGKWAFVLETEGGPREAPAEFKLDGEKVGGTWGAQPTKGTWKGGELALEFDFDSNEVGKGVMKMVGKLDGDSLTGKWEFQQYSGTFKATRPKE